jgi:hypothetical protein
VSVPGERGEDAPLILCPEQARWFAHRLFGQCGGAGPAGGGAAPGWRGGAASPKRAA